MYSSVGVITHTHRYPMDHRQANEERMGRSFDQNQPPEQSASIEVSRVST